MSVQRLGGQSPVDFSSVDSSQAAQSAGSTSAASSRSGFGPGDPVPTSGQWVCVDSRGNRVGKEKTLSAGEPFPPARPGLSYKLVDATKHSGGSGTGGRITAQPGEKAKVSGQWELVDERTGKGLDSAATVVKGEPLPPTPKSGQMWRLVDQTGTKRPGEKAEISGQYGLVDSNGKMVKNSEATVVKGETFPATPKSGQAWKLVDVSKHVSTEKMKGDFKPGQKATTSGQYRLVLADGTNSGKEVTVTKGEPFPPTRHKGATYKLVDATNK